MLVAGQGAGELALGAGRAEAAARDQGPEGGVVEIVDVGVHLAPAEVVAQRACGWVQHGTAIERGDRQERGAGEVGGPEVHVVGGEEAGDGGHELALAAVEQARIAA